MCVILLRTSTAKGDAGLLGDFSYIGLLLAAAIAVPGLIIVLYLALRFVRVRPSKPDPVKSSTYECGMETVGSSRVQFNFRYYFYALVFVVFDIEIVFLYPWAVRLKQLALFGLIEMLIFILILVVGFVYAWKKRVLEWR